MYNRYKIYLDAGHGLNTPKKKTPTGIPEWRLNDNVCKFIKANLIHYNCDVYRCDDVTGEEDIFPIGKRLEVADIGGADACISIHHNMIGDGSFHDGESVTGVEVFIHNEYTSQSKNLASIILNNLTNYTDMRNRGLKTSNLSMCEKRDYPTVLCEGGFMNNEKDCEYICSIEGQRMYAAAVSDALIKYFRLKYDPAKESNINSNVDHTYTVSDLPNDKVNLKLETKSLASAMAECDKYYGYKVYDENGNTVYSSSKQCDGDLSEKYANTRNESIPMRSDPDSLSQPIYNIDKNESIYVINKWKDPFWYCRTLDGSYRGYVYKEHLKKIK